MTAAFHYAKGYLKLGWSVIPIKPKDKSPMLAEWTTKQSDRATVQDFQRWFKGTAGVGIVCGSISGLLVLDIDGDIGRASMQGVSGVPSTPIVDTPNGRHVYFAHPGGRVNNAVALLPGLDIRGDGGYVVAPPSEGYSWVLSPSEVDLAPPPPWLVERLQKASEPKPEQHWRDLTVSEVREGQRDNTICALVGHLLRHRVDPVVTYNLVSTFNQTRVKPPLESSDIKRICRSVWQKEQRRMRP